MKKTKATKKTKTQKNVTQESNKLSLAFSKKSGKEKVVSIPVFTADLNAPYLNVSSYLKLANEPLFIRITHNQLQTLVDLSEVKPLQVLGFDESGNFIGVNKVGKKAEAPFQLLHQARYFLFLQTETPLMFQTLKGILIS